MKTGAAGKSCGVRSARDRTFRNVERMFPFICQCAARPQTPQKILRLLRIFGTIGFLSNGHRLRWCESANVSPHAPLPVSSVFLRFCRAGPRRRGTAKIHPGDRGGTRAGRLSPYGSRNCLRSGVEAIACTVAGSLSWRKSRGACWICSAENGARFRSRRAGRSFVWAWMGKASWEWTAVFPDYHPSGHWDETDDNLRLHLCEDGFVISYPGRGHIWHVAWAWEK
jgi:hypothetical protein